MKKICNKKFVLELSGISDIYNVFGNVVNYCQEVDILPYERFDKVKEALSQLKDMIEHIEHFNCVQSLKQSDEFVGGFPESEKINSLCKWQSYHLDLSDLDTHGKYRGVEVKKSVGEKKIETRLTTKNVTKDPIEIVKHQLLGLAQKLYEDLSKDLFNQQTIEIIEMTRIICDLNSIGFRLGEQGSVLVGTLTADTFVSTAKKITDTISDIPDDVLKDNYKLFLKHLETHLKSKDKNSEDSTIMTMVFLVQ